MAVRYEKLFLKMEEKQIGYAEMLRRAGFSGNILTRMRRNQYVSLESVEKACRALNCRVEEILEFDPEIEEDTKDY